MTRKRSRSPSEDADPTCPICLCDIQAVKDRAVVAGCMHVFCLPCLQRWVTYKRFCPLCKGPIKSYLYDIRSDDSYNECVLPDMAPSGRHSRWETPDSSHQHQPHRAAAQGGVPSTSAPRVTLRSEAWYTWGPAEGASSGRRWRRDERHNQQQQQQRQQRRRRSGPTTSSSASSSEGEAEEGQQPGAVQPRPYYWRLQQRMLASEPALAGPPPAARRSATTAAANNSTAAGAAAAGVVRPAPPRGHMRQQVYDSGLWAQPPAHNPAAAAGGRPLSAAAGANRSSRGGQQSSAAGAGMVGRVSQRAAEAWVDRDLQALLQEEDVMIVRAYVMGLVHSFGLQAPAAAQAPNQQQVMVAAAQAAAAEATRQQQQQQVAPETLAGPVASLRGFLFDKAAHFWHELCCFAGAGYTQDTYDRLVKYSWPEPLQAGAAPATGAVSQPPSPTAARQRAVGAGGVPDAAAGRVSATGVAALPEALRTSTTAAAAAAHAAAGAAVSGAPDPVPEAAAADDSWQQLLAPTLPGRHHRQQDPANGSSMRPSLRNSNSSSGQRALPVRADAGSPPHAAPSGPVAAAAALRRAQGTSSRSFTQEEACEPDRIGRRKGRGRSRSREGSVADVEPGHVQSECQELEQLAAVAHRDSLKGSRKHRKDRRSSRHHSSRRRSPRHRSYSSSSDGGSDGISRRLSSQVADRAHRDRQQEDSEQYSTMLVGRSAGRGVLPRHAMGPADREPQEAGHAGAGQQLVASSNSRRPRPTRSSKQDPLRRPQPSAGMAARDSSCGQQASVPGAARPPVGHSEQGAGQQQLELPGEQQPSLGAHGIAPSGHDTQHRKGGTSRLPSDAHQPQQELQGGRQNGHTGAADRTSQAAGPPVAMSRAAMLARVAALKASLQARRPGAVAPTHQPQLAP